MDSINFLDAQKVFVQCFLTDADRSKYMYMYSRGDIHYFKDIITRKYTIIECVIV